MKKIAITMGDQGGIGPEIIVKAFQEIKAFCCPIVVGDPDIIRDAVKLTGLSLEVIRISSPSESKQGEGTIEVIETGSSEPLTRNISSPESGRASVKCIKMAVELTLRDEVNAVVTAPISKESLDMAGFSWPGHTELLAELTGSGDFAMMFYSEKLKVVLSTIHIPLKDVPGALSRDVVYRAIVHAERAAGMLNIDKPVIAVAGLNPHAGESGIFGNEERYVIIPAIEDAAEEGISVSGPYPPDVIFHKAVNGEFDMVVSMYHDQALIPFKMLAFDTGVNVTLGLPIIRTSPDHGTAFDIAWRNKANPSSIVEAIKLASQMKLFADG